MTLPDNKYVPDYLRSKYELIGTVTFTALVSIVVLLLRIPFSQNAWFRLGNSVFFVFTLLFAAFCLLLIIFSRAMMYRTRKDFRMKWWAYILWCSLEVLLCCVMYTAFTVTIARPEHSTALKIFLSSISYGLLSLGVPYAIAAMYFIITHQEKTIRLMNLRNVPDDTPSGSVAPEDNLQKITLFDNSGSLKLSVDARDLYYIESDDNYIKVWYTDAAGELKMYMLRCRLKTVEESFLGTDLVRCHRKFIVNMAKVKVIRKERDGYVLDLDSDKIDPIPVTRTYAENVLGR